MGARGRLRQLLWLLLSQKLLLSLATDTMVDMAATAMGTDMVVMVTMAFMARGLLMLTPTMATEDTVDMVMATAMVMAMATATARDLRMSTTATEDTVDMVMATAMDMVMAMATATARDLRMPTTATEDTVDMVMDTVMATAMDTDTTDKKE